MVTQNTVIEHDPGDVTAFYEMVCFTYSLNPVRGDRIKPRSSAERDGIGVAKCRRDFADAIAYFCARSCDPDNVTAVAVGRKDTKVVIWVASNANVSREVLEFLDNDVLNMVQRLAKMKQGQLPSEENRTVTRLLTTITAWKAIGEFSKSEDKITTDPSMFYDWFKREFYKSGDVLKECDMPRLAISCFFAHTDGTFGILEHRSSQGNEKGPDYERLYKLLSKLGKHVRLFERMIHAIEALRRDFCEGFVVEPIAASIPKPNPLPKLHEQSMGKIVARVFQEEDERHQFYHHLNQFFNKEYISQSLQRCKKRRARVHAEILLIDFFDKFDANFLDNDDKYIACSKPACYLCYEYICQHPDKYTLPPTHQKLYYAWSLPIVRVNDRNCIEKFARHKRFLNHVTETLQSDLRKEVQRQLAPRKNHADSTAGASSVFNTGRVRPTSKIYEHHIRALTQLLSEAKISAKFDAGLEDEDGGVVLNC
ncbi:hypothetical protein BDV35DRAFT_375384 [Aspergillus flavus]|uniref:DNA, SC011 n=2 Tax=Aspergillus subgen. Circumdati TaxID=2720871 RepID=Q2U0Y0_ASPOR|nr:unnamed protein product [Aspergillus oryzae RIB40]KAB8253461.1 hypothetical protein BDV35DRAFT_375384 [Aspergillus flavus]BAE64785.1 unnamed protein product [Aspergillus oryzae RIB40]